MASNQIWVKHVYRSHKKTASEGPGRHALSAHEAPHASLHRVAGGEGRARSDQEDEIENAVRQFAQ